MTTCWFHDGLDARNAGQSVNDNPHVVGYTKLGAPKLSDEGREWERGFYSVPRVATAREVAAATALTDVGQFRSRHRRER